MDTTAPIDAQIGDETGIHGEIARLARDLHGRTSAPGPTDILAETTASAIAMLEPVDHAAITLVVRKRPRPELTSAAATDLVAQRFDELQHHHGQGPCLDAVWDHTAVRIRDMSTEHRWPAFAEAVMAELPTRSTLSIQLWITDTELGALNLHSERVDAFDFDTEQLAINLATHAAIALSGARRDRQFRSALASRDIIGQAKGILMERFDIDALDAFELLKKLSQDSNVAVVDLARRLVNLDHPTAGNDLRAPQPGEKP